MYREKELIGKEVIGADGRVIGEVIEITIRDDVPSIVVGDKRFLVAKERILKSESTMIIPYYYISTVHDKIILSKGVEEIKKMSPK